MNINDFIKLLRPTRNFSKCIRAGLYTPTESLSDVYDELRNINSSQVDEHGFAVLNYYEPTIAVDKLYSTQRYTANHILESNLDLNATYQNYTINNKILLVGEHVLLINQTNPVDNGVYTLRRDFKLTRADFMSDTDSLVRCSVKVSSDVFWMERNKIDLGSGEFEYIYPTITDEKRFKKGGDYLLSNEFEYRFLEKANYICKSVEYTYTDVYNDSGVTYKIREPKVIYLGGELGLIVKYDVGTNTVALIKSPTGENVNGIHFIDNFGWIVTDSGLLLRTQDYGFNWDIVLLTLEGQNINSIHFADKNNGVAVGDRGLILVSRDSGRTWQQHLMSEQRLNKKLNACHVHYDATFNKYYAYIGGVNGLILRYELSGYNLINQVEYDTNLLFDNANQDVLGITVHDDIWCVENNKQTFTKRLFFYGTSSLLLSVTPLKGKIPSTLYPESEWEIQKIDLPGLTFEDLLSMDIHAHVPSSAYSFGTMVNTPLTKYPGAVGPMDEYWYPARVYATLSSGELYETRLITSIPVINQNSYTLFSDLTQIVTNPTGVSTLVTVSESSIFDGSVVLDTVVSRPFNNAYLFGHNVYSEIATYQVAPSTPNNLNNGMIVFTDIPDTSLMSEIKSKLVILDYHIARKIQTDIQIKRKLNLTFSTPYVDGDGWIDWIDTSSDIDPVRNKLSLFGSIPNSFTFRTAFATSNIELNWAGSTPTVTSNSITLPAPIYINIGDYVQIQVLNPENQILTDLVYPVLLVVGSTITLDGLLSIESQRLLSGDSLGLGISYRVRNLNYFKADDYVTLPDVLSGFVDWLRTHPILGDVYGYSVDGSSVVLDSSSTPYISASAHMSTDTIGVVQWSLTDLDGNPVSSVNYDESIFKANYNLLSVLNGIKTSYNSAYKFRDVANNSILPNLTGKTYNTVSNYLTLLDNNKIVSDDVALLDFIVGTFCFIVKTSNNARTPDVYFITEKGIEQNRYYLKVLPFTLDRVPASGFSYNFSPASSDGVYLYSDLRLDELSQALNQSDDVYHSDKIYTQSYAAVMACDVNIREDVTGVMFSTSDSHPGVELFNLTDSNLYFKPATLFNIVDGKPRGSRSIDFTNIKIKPTLNRVVNSEVSGVYNWIEVLSDDDFLIRIDSVVYHFKESTNTWTSVLSNVLSSEKYVNPNYPASVYYASFTTNSERIQFIKYLAGAVSVLTQSDPDYPIDIVGSSFELNYEVSDASYLTYTNHLGTVVHKLWLSRKYTSGVNSFEQLGFIDLNNGLYTRVKNIQNPSYVRKHLNVTPCVVSGPGYSSEMIVDIRKVGTRDRVYLNLHDSTMPITLNVEYNNSINLTDIPSIESYLTTPSVRGTQYKKPVTIQTVAYPASPVVEVWIGSTGTNSGITHFIVEENAGNFDVYDLVGESVQTKLLDNVITSIGEDRQDSVVYWSTVNGAQARYLTGNSYRTILNENDVTDVYFDINPIDILAYTDYTSAYIPSVGFTYDFSESIGAPTIQILGNFSEDDIEQYVPFVYSAEVRDAKISLDSNNKLIWYSGDWLCGTWIDGTWYSGRFYSGIWKTGTWYSVDVDLSNPDKVNTLPQNKKSSQWFGGKWESGTWIDGTWWTGIWLNGIHEDGYWYDGCWFNGTWNNGEWYGGLWFDGIYNKGIFNQDNTASHWYSGYFRGGDFQNGTWHNGIFSQQLAEVPSTFGTRSSFASKAIWFNGTFKSGHLWSGRARNEQGQFYNLDNTSTEWWNGYFEGGTWHGGHWYLGQFIEGEWLEGWWTGYRLVPGNPNVNTPVELEYLTIVDASGITQPVLRIFTVNDLKLSGKEDKYRNSKVWITGTTVAAPNTTEETLGVGDLYRNFPIISTGNDLLKGYYIDIPFDFSLDTLSYSQLILTSEFTGGVWRSGVWEQGIKTGGDWFGGIWLNGKHTGGVMST